MKPSNEYENYHRENKRYFFFFYLYNMRLQKKAQTLKQADISPLPKFSTQTKKKLLCATLKDNKPC